MAGTTGPQSGAAANNSYGTVLRKNGQGVASMVYTFHVADGANPEGGLVETSTLHGFALQRWRQSLARAVIAT